jgi:hypothetical protein
MKERRNNHIKVKNYLNNKNMLLLFIHNNNEPIFCKEMVKCPKYFGISKSV